MHARAAYLGLTHCKDALDILVRKQLLAVLAVPLPLWHRFEGRIEALEVADLRAQVAAQQRGFVVVQLADVAVCVVLQIPQQTSISKAVPMHADYVGDSTVMQFIDAHACIVVAEKRSPAWAKVAQVVEPQQDKPGGAACSICAE